MDKAVFLDRDGTIARDVHYCRRPEDLEILPTVPEAVRLLNETGFKVVVITNQSGLARGFFDEATLSLIHDKMKHELSVQGARIDAVYYCPHHPDVHCACRKPGTALFEQAAREMAIDLNQSFVIGDTAMDIGAGQAVGAHTILVTTGSQPPPVIASHPDEIGRRGNLDGMKQPMIDSLVPDFTAPDMLTAAGWVLEFSERSVTTPR
jgi:D-glycero-D-manno-heptose 1,7-bisphosphate phosphatase